FSLELEICEVVRAVVHPDRVVVGRDREPGDAADLPLVGHRLRPAGIELITGRGLGLRTERDIQAGAEHYDQHLLHGASPPTQVTLVPVCSTCRLAVAVTAQHVRWPRIIRPIPHRGFLDTTMWRV